jgi:hypothetical protein
LTEYSLFPSQTPRRTTCTDTGAVELGMKFTADADGEITAIRFYKGTGNTGTHYGALWTDTGQKLASIKFTNETYTGWQKARITPVKVKAGARYVVSYHAPRGRYAADEYYFNTACEQGPLSGLESMYRYGRTAGMFPSDSWRASNYWVDVVFAATATVQPPPTQPPVQPPVVEPPTQPPVVPPTQPPATGISHGADVPSSGLMGVRAGVSLKALTSDLVVTNAWLDANAAPGDVIRGLRVSGAQIRPASGVRPFALEDCLFVGPPKGGGFVCTHPDYLGGYGAPKITLRNSTLDGQGALGPQLSALGPGPNLDLYRVDLKGHHQGINTVGNATIAETWMHDMALKLGSGAHGECVLWPFGANVHLLRSWFIDVCQGDSTTGVSSAVSIYNETWNGAVPDGQQPHDGSVVECVLEGGSYALYGGATDKATPWAYNLTVRGNRFYRTKLRFGHNTNSPNPACAFADTSQGGRNNVWDNNRWGPLGPANQSGDPAEGTLIPSPGGWGSPH